MTGYKVFVWRNVVDYTGRPHRVGWGSPYYAMPTSWKVATRQVLATYCLNEDIEEPCGVGVNFFQRLRDAKEWVEAELCYDSSPYRCIYKVSTPKDATVVKVIVDANIDVNYPHWKLARANKVKLVKRVGLYKYGKKVSKMRR